ncbi:MAG: hypothetical protein P1S46_09610 [bacterium]|nr:hypothetical protein [bacterium]MDT8396075.1 hypothetical protein [bacterium]
MGLLNGAIPYSLINWGEIHIEAGQMFGGALLIAPLMVAIASVIHITFALLGEAAFSKFMRAEFASFQIFGGIVFLIVGVFAVEMIMQGTTVWVGRILAAVG